MCWTWPAAVRLGNHQSGGDLLVAESLRHQFGDLSLSLGQCRGRTRRRVDALLPERISYRGLHVHRPASLEGRVESTDAESVPCTTLTFLVERGDVGEEIVYGACRRPETLCGTHQNGCTCGAAFGLDNPCQHFEIESGSNGAVQSAIEAQRIRDQLLCMVSVALLPCDDTQAAQRSDRTPPHTFR